MRTKLHPAARNTPLKHQVSGPPIRSSEMPAQTNLLANVLSGEKPRDTLYTSGRKKPPLPKSMNIVSGSTIRTTGGGGANASCGAPLRCSSGRDSLLPEEVLN